MITYTIGRSDKQDIVFDEPTISRFHAELVVSESGLLFLTDCKSSLGTRMAKNGNWVEVKQSFVEYNDILLLGRYEVGVSELLEAIAEVKPNPLEGRLERNEQSGELRVKGK